MKHLSAIFLSLLLLALPTILAAQDKFGYLNLQELLIILPEYKAAQDSLQTYHEKLNESYLKLQEDYNKLFQEYESGSIMCSPFSSKLADLERRMQKIPQSWEQQLLEKEAELLKPITALIMNAIKAIAKEQGYTYIFDTSSEALIFWPEANNIFPLVMQKLGGSWVSEKGLD